MTSVADDTTMDVPTRLGELRVRMCGSGPPAVLWHSLFVDSTTWNRVLPLLGEHRRLILIDGPSHGSSSAVRRRFTLRDCADAAGDVLDHLGVDVPVDWVGNAWGGHVGIMFAAAKPERCRSLVTIGTPVRALTPAERRRIVPLVALYRILGPVRLLVEGVETALLGTEPPSTDARVIGTALRGADRRGMYAAMRSVMLHRPDLTAVLAPLATPTLMVAAEQDALWQPNEALSAVGHLPHRAFGTLPGAGHVAPMLQHAPALAAMVSDFWQYPDTFSARHRSLA